MPRRSRAASRGCALALRDLYPLAQGGTAVGTGLNSKPKFARAVCQACRQDHQAALHQRRQQVRGAGLQRRLCLRAWRHQCGGHRPVQDRQRYPLARVGPAFRPRGTDPARERAGLLDHAGQGQPDAVRGDDHGLLPGVRQPCGHHRRRQPGPFRAERLQAGTGILHDAFHPTAGRRRPLIHRALRRGDPAPTKSASGN